MTVCENIIKNIGLEEFNSSLTYMAGVMEITEGDVVVIMNNIDKFKSVRGINKSTKRRFMRYFKSIDIVVVYIKKEIKAEFFAEYNEIIKRNVSSVEYRRHLDGVNSEIVVELMNAGRKTILPKKQKTKISQKPAVVFVPKSEYAK